MKYNRGATGREVIPNIEFWSSLPGLIKVNSILIGVDLVMVSSSSIIGFFCHDLYAHIATRVSNMFYAP
jgi:hypothetical protein